MSTHGPINFYDCQRASQYVHTSIIFEISLYAKCVRENFFPTFQNLSDEADNFAEKIFWESHRPSLSEEADYSDLAEYANEKSIEFYIGMNDVHQGFTNLFAAGFYHVFEQHLKSFYVYPWLITINKPSWLNQENMRTIEPKDKKKDIQEVTNSLKENGIEVENFSSWNTINKELRELANTIKHGEGSSSKKLRQINPALFFHPSVHPTFPAEQVRVRCPIIGENLFVSLEDFNRYVQAVQSFWGELSDVLPTLGNKIPVEPKRPFHEN